MGGEIKRREGEENETKITNNKEKVKEKEQEEEGEKMPRTKLLLSLLHAPLLFRKPSLHRTNLSSA
jgi:hypothetical protein